MAASVDAADPPGPDVLELRIAQPVDRTTRVAQTESFTAPS